MANGNDDGLISQWMVKLFGYSWKTTFGGIIETICLLFVAGSALPKETWTKPSVWIPTVALLLAKTFKDSRTKDKFAPPVAKFDPTDTVKP